MVGWYEIKQVWSAAIAGVSSAQQKDRASFLQPRHALVHSGSLGPRFCFVGFFFLAFLITWSSRSTSSYPATGLACGCCWKFWLLYGLHLEEALVGLACWGWTWPLRLGHVWAATAWVAAGTGDKLDLLPKQVRRLCPGLKSGCG